MSVICLACRGEGERIECDHDECQELESCLFSDEVCKECNGDGVLTAPY